MGVSRQQQHSTTPGRLRRWAGPGILFLVPTGLQLGGFVVPAAAYVCLALAALWCLYLAVPWDQVRQRIPRFALLRADQVVTLRADIKARDQALADAEAAKEDLSHELAKRSMEHDTTISRVTGDWSARVTGLEMQLAAAKTELAEVAIARDDALANTERITADRAAALARLHKIEETRPLLSVEARVVECRDESDQLVAHEARLRVVNKRPHIWVRDFYVRISSWFEVTHQSGLWPGDQGPTPNAVSITLPQVPGRTTDFRDETEIVVASLVPGAFSATLPTDPPSASIPFLGRSNMSTFGTKLMIEVSAENVRPPIMVECQVTVGRLGGTIQITGGYDPEDVPARVAGTPAPHLNC